MAETMVSLGLIFFRYYAFFEWRMGTITDPILKKGGDAGDQALGSMAVAFGMGFTTLVEFIFSPLTLLLFYFSIEGALRLFAALVTYECTGTMPLYLVGWALGRAGKARQERRLGPRVPDDVQPCEGISYDLVIASCRPKPGWNRMITIEYQDKLYELFEEKKGFPPRPYIYQLRLHPRGKVVRGPHHYHPDEALTEKERAALSRQPAKQEEE